MKKSFCLFTVAALASIPMAHGSVFIGDFTGLGVGAPLDGYDSWTQSESNPPGTDYLAWGMTVGGNNGFGVGPANSEPAGSILSVSHAVDNVALVGGPIKTTLLTSFAISDSINDYPARNDYSIGIYNGGGTRLLSLDMVAQGQNVPEANSNDKWNWYWTVGNTTSLAIGAIFEDNPYPNGALYNLSVTFTTIDANNVAFELNVTGINTYQVLGTMSGAGMGSQTIAEYRVSTSIASGIVIPDPENEGNPIPVADEWGSGYIMITGVSVIPEPGSAMLLGLSALALVRRRRSA